MSTKPSSESNQNPMNKQRTTAGKALRINLDNQRYGSFAEIGAGQEVARHFFTAGKASQTVALTISAYDMIFSDHIYGKEESGRYVCQSRLEKMLDHEYSKLDKRLGHIRGNNTCFFAFASTVATSSSSSSKQSHGWVGIRFQSRPGGPINDILLHVRMIDPHRLLQQETLGVLGVNLCFCAFYYYQDPSQFISQLIDNIKENSLMIDALLINGEDLKLLNEHKLNLELVQRGYSEAILFSPKMEISDLSDTLWNKSILVQRGNYSPVTKTHIDILRKGCEQLKADHLLQDKDYLAITELSTDELQNKLNFDYDDYLTRIEALTRMGCYVLVSNLKLFYRLKNLLRKFTQKSIAIVVGANVLDKLFDETHYNSLEGGLLEGLGKLLDKNTHLYVYPDKTDLTCLTARTFNPSPEMSLIYQHYLKNQAIKDISGCDESERYWHSDEVHTMIMNKDPKWKDLVPKQLVSFYEKQMQKS